MDTGRNRKRVRSQPGDQDDVQITGPEVKQAQFQGDKRDHTQADLAGDDSPEGPSKRVLRSHTRAKRGSNVLGEDENTPNPEEKKIRLEPAEQTNLQVALLSFVSQYFRDQGGGTPRDFTEKVEKREDLARN